MEKITGNWAMVENIQNYSIGNTSVILIFTKQYCISVMDNYEDGIKINEYLVDKNNNIKLVQDTLSGLFLMIFNISKYKSVFL